ncbi:hypothetical protein PIB30_110160, partial [Stylosanthes scabra]|nr:hypothetical protein [Stylosanthes scabra]
TPRICVGLAVLWVIAASSTHKHGLPRLCAGHLNLGRAKLFFHAYALLRRMCVALKKKLAYHAYACRPAHMRGFGKG